MEGIIKFLSLFCIHFDSNTPDFIILAGYFLILSVFILLNVVNIMIYLLSIYIVSNEKFLNKIPSKYVYVHKL